MVVLNRVARSSFLEKEMNDRVLQDDNNGEKRFFFSFSTQHMSLSVKLKEHLQGTLQKWGV